MAAMRAMTVPTKVSMLKCRSWIHTSTGRGMKVVLVAPAHEKGRQAGQEPSRPKSALSVCSQVERDEPSGAEGAVQESQQRKKSRPGGWATWPARLMPEGGIGNPSGKA